MEVSFYFQYYQINITKLIEKTEQRKKNLTNLKKLDLFQSSSKKQKTTETHKNKSKQTPFKLN